MAQPESILLFYRPPVEGGGRPSRPGVAVTGRLDAAGTYTDLVTHGGFDRWTHVVAAGDTSGLVLFQTLGGQAAVGLVGVDGSFVDLNARPDTPIANARIVSTRDGILLFYSTATENGAIVGIAVTGRLAPDGSFVALGEPRRLDFWTHIVPTADGLVLFYRSDNGVAATGRITRLGAIEDLKGFTDFDPWTQIVCTSDGILLFYNRETGAALTATVDEDGNCQALRNLSLDRGWGLVVPTTNGLLLFYRPAGPTTEAAVGRVDPRTGAFFDVSSVNGLEPWTTIVAVRPG